MNLNRQQILNMENAIGLALQCAMDLHGECVNEY